MIPDRRASARIPIWIYLAGVIPLCAFLVFSTPSKSISRITQYASFINAKEPTALTNTPDERPTVAEQPPSNTLQQSDTESASVVVDETSKRTSADEATSNSVESKSPAENVQPVANKSLKLCTGDMFYIPEAESPRCFVRAPSNYTRPREPDTERLWNVPRANLGELDTTAHDYYNQLHNQRWAIMGKENVHFREVGGTAVRSFRDNFEYMDLVLAHTRVLLRQCAGRPVILDTGAGVASFAAAAKDPRGASGAAVVLSYVPVDNYLRLGTIIADRGLPVFLHQFTGGRIPAPDQSFDIVHCRWCWHHNMGYDLWLTEVYRLLRPGGAFVFTFVPLRDTKLLPPDEWNAARDKFPWDCIRHNRIIQVCIKRGTPVCAPAPEHLPPALGAQTAFAFKNVRNLAESAIAADRILVVNCVSAAACMAVEKAVRKPVVLHTFANSSRGYDDLRTMTQYGSVGILHDWPAPGPFYPRMFDVALIACEKEEQISDRLLVELHRVLRPDGLIVAASEICPYVSNITGLLEAAKFQPLFDEDNVLIARRVKV